MYNRKENQWTEKIAELLKKELDEDKYLVVCFERVPYATLIKDNGEVDIWKYEVDLLIKEKVNNEYVPRLIIESKYDCISTHDVITYNDKAKCHKSLYAGLKYGMMVGNCKQSVPSRFVQHNDEFDFIIVFNDEEPTEKEFNVFIDIIRHNLNSASKMERMIFDRRKKSKERYFCIERKEFYHTFE